MVKTGKIKIYFKQKGYGFITNDKGEDVFFHHTSLPGEDGHKDVFEGDVVSYVEQLNGGKLRTDDITLIVRAKEVT